MCRLTSLSSRRMLSAIKDGLEIGHLAYRMAKELDLQTKLRRLDGGDVTSWT
jgi:hypothetical protein